MTKSMSDQEKRLAQLRREVLARGFERHPLVLKSVYDLPHELQSVDVVKLASNETIRTIIVFPPQIQRGWHYVPKQALLFTSTGIIHLRASIWPDHEPQVAVVQRRELMCVKVTLLLLYGFLEIVAQGDDSLVRIEVEFNTVAWCFLSMPLRAFMQSCAVMSGSSINNFELSSSLQQDFEKLPLKFSNGVKIYGLLPGEKLEDMVFQTGAWKRKLHFFRRSVTANTLLLLTSNYVVVIQEELNVHQGWIVSYIPRCNIVEIQNQPCGLWGKLIVDLKRGNQTAECKFLLKNESVDACRILWRQQGGLWSDLPAADAK